MRNRTELRTLELFAGAGGLALGGHQAGLKPHTVVEWDSSVLQSFEAQTNRFGNPNFVHDDVRNVDFSSMPETDVITGGPPCQPFSNGGLHKANLDPRDMFPQAIRAVRELSPEFFVFENVRGLARPAFSSYVSKIVESLENPWDEKLPSSEGYRVSTALLNAADFGVPQKRYRLFFMGVKQEHGVTLEAPTPTHSKKMLDAAKANGSYWQDHGISQTDKAVTLGKFNGDTSRWQTTRDAISNLPDPTSGANDILNHEFRDGARSYPGHTGSELDQPSKTIKAGVHGVPGGENMVRLDSGQVRYFTIREAARIQSFPDWYKFQGAWSSAMKQIGNAVPPLLAQSVISSAIEQMSQNRYSVQTHQQELAQLT